MRSLRWGRGAEEPFGESPPPLETINKGPKRCTFLHTRPTRTSACLSRGKQVGQRPEPPLSLSPQPSQDLETKRADLFFLLPALLPTSKQTQEQEQASQNPRSAPAAATGDAGRRAGPAEADQSRGRPRSLREPVRPPGVSALAPPSPSSATASRPSRCPDSRPSHPAPPQRRQKRVQPGHCSAAEGEAARTPARPPPTQRGSPAQVAASARSSPPPARALTHLQVSVRLSIGTRAAGGPAGAGQPGLDGAGPRGRRESGRRAREQRQEERRRRRADGRRRRGAGGGGASLALPTGARRSVRPGLRAPGSERGGRGAGRGRGGAGERGGGSDPGLQPAPETRRGPLDPQEVCNDTSYEALRALGRRCPEGVWTHLASTHRRARARSLRPDRCAPHDPRDVLKWAALRPAAHPAPSPLFLPSSQSPLPPWNSAELHLKARTGPYKNLFHLSGV